jgi:hypothetical protein
LDLDHDLFARPQARGVHLGDRRRRQRLFRELGEQRLEWRAQVGFDHLAHVGEGLGRHVVAQLAELVDDLRREQALTAGEDLTQLHVARAELLERPPQPARQAGA